MRTALLLLLFALCSTGKAQLNNWDPSWYTTDSALIFHDDLDYYLNAYSKPDRLSEVLRQQIFAQAKELGYCGPSAAGRVDSSGNAAEPPTGRRSKPFGNN